MIYIYIYMYIYIYIYDEAFGYLKRAIVTPAVYLRLFELHHFDIQSTRPGPARGVPARPRFRGAESGGSLGGPEEWGSQVTAGSIASYSSFFTYVQTLASTDVQTLPWDPLVYIYIYIYV